MDFRGAVSCLSNRGIAQSLIHRDHQMEHPVPLGTGDPRLLGAAALNLYESMPLLPKPRPLYFITSLHPPFPPRSLPRRVDIQQIARHNSPSAPSLRLYPMTEEGE